MDEVENPRIAGRASLTNFHGFTAFVVLSSVAARFFTPQLAGAGALPPLRRSFPHRSRRAFNQTTHLQYQPWKNGPWVGFNWRYDSGLVAGPVPCAGGNCNNGPNGTRYGGGRFQLSSRSAISSRTVLWAGPRDADHSDQRLAGLCPASQYGSTLVKIPAPGTENDDHNPPRIAPRNLFDLPIGHDNIFHGDKYKWSARFTVINLTNQVALYNFLSTFSGTHYVTPRTLTAQIGFHF